MKMFDYVNAKISSQITMMRNFVDSKKYKLLQNTRKISNEEKIYIQKLRQFIFLYDIDDKCYRYIRIGSKRDGGYIMVEPLSRTKIAYSIGICDNVDWDSQMVDKGYEVFMKKGFHWFKTGICGGGGGESKFANTRCHVE